jgi:hypothetical protein
MAERVVRQTPTTTTEPVADEAPARTTVAEPARGSGRLLVARVVWFLCGVLEVLLAFRFVLALLGANPANGFANFIYDVSRPFVEPFFSLFSYRTQYGVSRFEIYTLVAMAVYALIALGIVKLLTIDRPRGVESV